MATYVVKSDLNLGEQSNDIGVRTPVTVTKGQIINGDITTKFVLNTNTQGVEYKVPTKIMGMGKPADGMDTFFIPLSNLDVQTSGTKVASSSTVPESDKTFEYVVIAGLAIIIGISALKLFKLI